METLTSLRELTRHSGPEHRVTVRAFVRGDSQDFPLVRADDEKGQQYLLNKTALGALWGKVKRGDTLELSVLPAPGQSTKILSVRRT